MVFTKNQRKVFKDFVLSEKKSTLWRRSERNGTYYATSVKSIKGGRVDLELQLPPSIQESMCQAIKQGKHIRLFVPDDGLGISS